MADGDERPPGAHARAETRSERTARRRRTRRVAATRLLALLAAVVLVVAGFSLAAGHLRDPQPQGTGPEHASTPSDTLASTGDTGDGGEPDGPEEQPTPAVITHTTDGAGRPTAVRAPRGRQDAAPEERPTPEAEAPAPGSPGRAGPREHARDLLATFDHAVSAAAPGALVATAPLGRDVATTPVEVRGEWGTTRLRNGLTLARNHGNALRAGLVRAQGTLPTATGRADVRVPGGATRRLPVLSPAQALRQLQVAGRGRCGGCVPVVVTGVSRTTMTIGTTAGPVRVPAWEFRVAGTTARIVRAAIAPTGLVQVAPPYRQTVPSGQLPLWQVSVAPGGRTVTARLDRGAIRADPGCWRLSAHESPRGVALVAARGAANATGRCADGRGRVAVTLSSPLGARTLLDTYWQRALPGRP